MEWIEDYLQDEFKIGNKDNWNPADIWGALLDFRVPIILTQNLEGGM